MLGPEGPRAGPSVGDRGDNPAQDWGAEDPKHPLALGSRVRGRAPLFTRCRLWEAACALSQSVDALTDF